MRRRLRHSKHQVCTDGIAVIVKLLLQSFKKMMINPSGRVRKLKSATIAWIFS